jgi:hypothetical protein
VSRVITEESTLRERRQQEFEEQQTKVDFKSLMEDVRFRRIVGLLLQDFDPFKGAVSCNGSENYYLDGRAAAGKWMLDWIVKSCSAQQFAQVLLDFRKSKQGENQGDPNA